MIATAAVAPFAHAPVLAAEVVEALHPRDHGIYIDGTVGGAGHATHLLGRAPAARLILSKWFGVKGKYIAGSSHTR